MSNGRNLAHITGNFPQQQCKQEKAGRVAQPQKREEKEVQEQAISTEHVTGSL